MKNTHILEIMCDSNDGDYVYSHKEWNPKSPKVAIQFGTMFPQSPSITLVELVDALAKSIGIPRNQHHNWSRPDYDSMDNAEETSEFVIRILFGNLISDEFWEIHREDLLEAMIEIISDLLPYGEDGVHTIEQIVSRHIADSCTLASTRSHRIRREAKIVAHNNGAMEYINADLKKYDEATMTWVESGYSSFDESDGIIWKK